MNDDRLVLHKLMELVSERRFYALALDTVRQYYNGGLLFSEYETLIHRHVLTINKGYTVPHRIKGRFADAVCEYYLDEVMSLKNAAPPPTAHITDPACATLTIIEPNQPEETITMTIKVETITFVNNIKFDDLSNTLCYDHIKNAEKQIDKLKAMKTQPKSAIKTISELEQGIADLVQLMDKRTEATNDE